MLASTKWEMTFAANGNAQQILVDSVFIVDLGQADPRIILYLANQDIMQVLKDRGIQAS